MDGVASVDNDATADDDPVGEDGFDSVDANEADPVGEENKEIEEAGVAVEVISADI